MKPYCMNCSATAWKVGYPYLVASLEDFIEGGRSGLPTLYYELALYWKWGKVCQCK
jgi:hypothetical protein